LRITDVTLHRADVPLTRPYAVANHATDTACMVLLRLHTDGTWCGLGAATPEPEVNGDTLDGAFAQLQAVGAELGSTAVKGYDVLDIVAKAKALLA
jgi:L-alanine-DL-glutamate epimerase-like enolase superfamily enzyme